jgi:subtilase family protein
MQINPKVKQLPPRGLAEKVERAPKLAILDDFDGDPAGFPHGQAVESVLLGNSELTDADVQRYQNSAPQADLATLMNDKGLDFHTAYRTVVSRNIAHFYLQTTLNLREIMANQPEIKVISQSQGETPGRLLETLFSQIQNNENLRAHATHSLGLGQDAPLGDVCQKLLNSADQVMADNEFCQKARDEYTKTTKALYQKGVTYLVAAGNHGEVGQVLESLGVQAGPASFRNILVNDYVTVVGAHDTQGKPSKVNSPAGAIEVYRVGEELAWSAAEGFNQSGVADGTSFATPIAAAEAVEYLEHSPDAGPFSVESHLTGTDAYRVYSGETVKTSNGQELKADGKLESYIESKIGDGFLTDITSEDATGIAQASQDSTLFGLPGRKDHEFQVVKMRTDSDGTRVLTLDTYFDEGHHVVQAEARDGRWDPATVVEELHLDPKRKESVEQS